MPKRHVAFFIAAWLLGGAAFASTERNLNYQTASGYTGSCGSAGVWGPLRVPRCTGNVSGSFLIEQAIPILGQNPTIRVQQLTLVARGEVSGADDQLRLLVACTAMPTISDATSVESLSFGEEAELLIDLGTVGCVQNRVCEAGPSTTVAIWNHATGANCAGLSCSNKRAFCRYRIDGSTPNAFPRTVDLVSEIRVFGP